MRRPRGVDGIIPHEVKMVVALKPELQKLVEEKVKAGLFPSADALVNWTVEPIGGDRLNRPSCRARIRASEMCGTKPDGTFGRARPANWGSRLRGGIAHQNSGPAKTKPIEVAADVRGCAGMFAEVRGCRSRAR